MASSATSDTVGSSRQVIFLRADINRIINQRRWRYLALPFCASLYAIFSYRLDRAGFEAFGERWRYLRFPLVPIFFLCQTISSADIHYHAEIGGGFAILHPALGVVISGFVVAGEHLTLTGGNCLGGQPHHRHTGALSIGGWVVLGANATVLAPAILGDRVVVGAGAVVLCDVPDAATAVGVPARVVRPPAADEQGR